MYNEWKIEVNDQWKVLLNLCFNGAKTLLYMNSNAIYADYKILVVFPEKRRKTKTKTNIVAEGRTALKFKNHTNHFNNYCIPTGIK